MASSVSDTALEDREELEASVASALAELSQADQAPQGVDVAALFDPSDVDWESNGWMGRVQSVVGWLRLPSDLDLRSPSSFVSSLGAALDPSGTLEPSLLDSEKLESTGLARLGRRCSRALQLQKQFLEDLEEDGSSRSAEREWFAAWEEADDDPDLSAAGPVSASADTWSITDFARRASTGKLNLSPSYQRGDVWPTPDAQTLIESILRGIPLPSVIILKPQNSATGEFEVVDGKQRLTAILRFMGAHPKALEIVRDAAERHPEHRLNQLFKEDYRKFRLAWKDATGEQLTDKVERSNYFPFKLRSGTGKETALQGPLAGFQGRYYSEIHDLEVAISDGKVAVWEVFESASDYKIPLIQYTKATPKQVHEVFKLYNKQGKQLNAEEIRNAMYHELDLTRALLVAAGDSAHPTTVAPFLYTEAHDTLTGQGVADLGQSLAGYQFGVTRYKRTKVLSWLVALLLLDSCQPGQKPARRSTAGQIDELLRRVEDDKGHPLRDQERLRDLVGLVAAAVEVHRAVPDAWHTRLRTGSDHATGRWQEMPLVGTLLGVTQAVLVLDENEVVDALDDSANDIVAAARTNHFRRPKNIQTASQWGYISRLALGVAEMLGARPGEAHDAVVRRFGSSGIAALIEVADLPESG